MPGVRLFKRCDARFIDGEVTHGDADAAYGLARLITPTISESLGAGLVTFHHCCVEWTLLYDEVLVVLSGKFRLRFGPTLSEVIDAEPGDVLWLPQKTHLAYEGEHAELFFAVHPGNWRTLHGMSES